MRSNTESLAYIADESGMMPAASRRPRGPSAERTLLSGIHQNEHSNTAEGAFWRLANASHAR